MLSTFTTEHGTLIIRTQDIRRIEDTEGEGCRLAWNEEDGSHFAKIEGTAQENLDRLKAEELDAIAQAEARQLAAQQAQQRVQQGFPPIPILRGGKHGRG